MKFIKLDDRTIDKIILNQLDHIGIINDQDQISVNDEIEFFNNSNVVFGIAIVTKVIIQNSSEFDNGKDNKTRSIKIIRKSDSDIDITKILYFKFKSYEEPHKLATNSDLDVMEIKIYADGGSRGNPGPSASGYVLLTKDDQIIKQNGIYIGVTTNNQAEYRSLLFALKDAVELESKIVSVYMDSLLVINQMNGIYKIKNPDLIPIHREITVLLNFFHKITFAHVPRELNKLADLEVNKCLDLQINA
ncbi:MAG TPA: ribonuclease HI family protein [Candidatus Dormibacteraeota bacterium]|nr:ribonuclease HI family protein [Candidatus Dormibacteraeota bacterium]